MKRWHFPRRPSSRRGWPVMILLLLTGLAHAQPPAGEFNVSLTLGPTMGYRLVADDFLLLPSRDERQIVTAAQRNQFDAAGSGFRGGATFNYIFINGWFGWGGGLAFREHEYDFAFLPQHVYPAGRDNLPLPGVTPTPDETRTARWNYLDVPLFVHFQTPYTRWQPFVKVGLMPSVLLGWEMTEGTAGETRDITDAFLLERMNRFHMNAMVQPGIRYWFLNTWAVSIELPMQMDFLPVFRGNMREWQYGIGINLGVQFQLPHVAPNGPNIIGGP